MTVSLPDLGLVERLIASGLDAEYIVWDCTGTAPREEIDLVVLPYMGPTDRLCALAGLRTRLVQSQSIGFDGVAEVLPSGIVFANAAGVHETSTAELALALILASLRGIPGFVRAQLSGRWMPRQLESLADKTVLVVGYGSVGAAIEHRLEPFETNVVRVATRARTSPQGLVHATEDLPELLPEADVVVLTVPLTSETRHLVSAAFLARMQDGALLVNVARGQVVDTDALLNELLSGRLRAALDVTDPEPLPDAHPLWSAPNLLISPHVGGASSAMAPRMAALIARQVERILRGEEPLNVVLRT